MLGRLNDIVRTFVKKRAVEQGMSESEASETGGKIYTFGSYRLGVHAKGFPYIANDHNRRRH